MSEPGRRDDVNERNEMDETGGLDRRDVLRHGLVWSGIAGVAALGAPTSASAERGAGIRSVRESSRELELDVACLGDTLRLAPAPAGEPVEGLLGGGLLYGSSFLVEGNIYPAGTIEGPGFDPRNTPGSGHWLCRGWIMGRSERPVPGVLTTQEYLLATISGDDPFPADQLVSSGVEPDETGQSVARSLIGGTGEFAGAAGVVIQIATGTNTTRILGRDPAPNFRFRFELR